MEKHWDLLCATFTKCTSTHFDDYTLQLSVGVSCMHGASQSSWRESPKSMTFTDSEWQRLCIHILADIIHLSKHACMWQSIHTFIETQNARTHLHKNSDCLRMDARNWPCIHQGNKSARSSCVWEWSTVTEHTSTTVFTIAVNFSTGNQEPFFHAQCEAGAGAHCLSITTVTLRTQMSRMKHKRMTEIERSLHYTHTTVVHLHLQQLSGREFRCMWPGQHAYNCAQLP